MRSLLLGVAGMWIAACAAQRLASAPPMPVPSPANLVILSPRPPPVSTPSATPAPLRYLSYWQDASRLTKDHANVIDVAWPEGDAQLAVAIQAMNDAVTDGRAIILSTPFFAFGPTPRSDHGYTWNPDGLAQWQQTAPLLAPYLPHLLAFYLMDEPDASAYGDIGPGGYDPNLYNDILTHAITTIRATFPSAPIALNYHAIPDGLVIPAGVTWIGLESYGVSEPSDNLIQLEARLQPDQAVMLMPQAFVNADPATDADVARWAQQEYAYARTDPHVIGLRPFLWCVERLPHCDDVATPADPFYTVGGDHLPLSRAAFVAIGRAILARAGR